MALKIAPNFEDLLKKINDPFGLPPTPEQIEEATQEKLKQLRIQGEAMALRRVNELEQAWEQNRKETARRIAEPGEHKLPMPEMAKNWLKNAEGNDNMVLQAMLESALTGKQIHLDFGSNMPGPIYKDPRSASLDDISNERKLKEMQAKYGQRGFESLLAGIQADM
jgi:hypothetical protein